MDSDKSIHMSRPTALIRRVNLENCQKFSVANFKAASENSSTLSPMTNLVHNLSGASLDSTPKRKLSNHDLLEVDESLIGLSG